MSLTLLPKANLNFVALKQQGGTHSLETKLEHATLSGSSELHAIKPHIKQIAGVFANPFVQHGVRSGGFTKSQQAVVYKKILKAVMQEDHSIINNSLKKQAIKKVIQHFGKEQTAVHLPADTASPYPGRATPLSSAQRSITYGSASQLAATKAKPNTLPSSPRAPNRSSLSLGLR